MDALKLQVETLSGILGTVQSDNKILKEKYEQHHKVRISDSSLVAAATLSNRYITDRVLPDKAIDLVDEAAARLRMQMGDFEGAEALLSSGGGGSREDLYNLGEVEFAKGDVDAAAVPVYI